MQNDKTKDIQYLRAVCDAETRPAMDRIRAASKLITRWGATDRNVPIVRRLLKALRYNVDPEVQKRIEILSKRLARKLGEKIVPREGIEAESISQSSVTAVTFGGASANPAADEWDNEPPLSLEEQFRLIDVERPFQHYVCGNFVLKPGADSKKMLAAALDGRPFTIENIRKLYGHLKHSIAAGGVSLDGGSLFSVTTQILIDAGFVLSKLDVPPDPRDPSFDPKLEERADAITAAVLMRSDINPCDKYMQILAAAFPESTPDQYPHIALQTWYATKDWRRAKRSEPGFDEEKSEQFRAITRLQTAAVKYLNTHHLFVPRDPKFNLIEELASRD